MITVAFNNEEKLKLAKVILEKTNDYIALLDLEGKYLYKSPNLNHLLPDKEVTASGFLNDIHNEDKEEVKKFLKEIIETGTGSLEEYKLTDKENKIHYLKSHGELLVNEDKSVKAIALITYDFTKQKELVQEAEKLKTIINQSSDEVVITNKEGVVEYVNPAFEKDTGYSKEEAVGSTIRKLISGKNDQRFYEEVWTKITDGQCFHGEVINKTKNGGYINVNKKITPIKDINGNITHFVSTSKMLEKDI